MNSIDSSTDGLSWNQWLTVGLLLQKTTGEESCYAERDLFENVFRAWASYFDGQQLLSASAAERWMLSFSSEATACTFCRNIFPLLDRDGDGYLQAHEFVLGMITLLKDTCCSAPPCPALVKSQRQMAFQHYDQDKDGLLGGTEWTRFVDDCLIQSAEPLQSALNSNFGICVRGVSQCLAARNENELIVPRRLQQRTGLLWAEDFWMERRSLISYDAFYEALERGMFTEPRKFMELDLLRPPLHQWVASNLKSQDLDRKEDFGKLVTEGLKFTVSMFNGVKETLLPIITQQAKAGYDQALSLLNSSEGTDLVRANQNILQTPDPGAPPPLAAINIPSEVESPSDPASDDVPSELSSTVCLEPNIQSSSSSGLQEVMISVPSTESLCKHDTVEVPERVTDLTGARTSRSLIHEKVNVAPSGEATGQSTTDDCGESPEECQENRNKLVKFYIEQMARLMSREKAPKEDTCSSSDLLLLCESLGQRMLFAENVCHKIQPLNEEELTFVGDIGGDVERTRKIIREICIEQNGYWRLPESSKIVFAGNILSANSLVREQPNRGTNNLDVLLTIWAFKAVYPLNVFLLRGRNEACSHSQLLEECESKWGAVEGKQMWNVFLDTWEMAPLAYDIGGEGCVYGASFTGAVEAIWDGLDDLKRPLKIDATSDSMKFDSDYIGCDLWTSSDRAAMHSLEDKVKAVRESYSSKNSPDFIAAVIRLRTRFGFNWIIQDQFVTNTSKVEHSRWFDIARLRRSHKEAAWVLDSYRGDLRERIWPSQHSEKCGTAMERDLAMITTTDGVSPSPSISEDIDRFLHPS